MQGVPTTVSVSGIFLKKCMNDREKAKYLEENLAAIPDSVKSLCNSVNMAPGSPVVTYAAYKIDDNGNISMMSGSTNDPDGKIARENAERRAERKEQMDKLTEGTFTVSATGTDVKSVTQNIVTAVSGISSLTGGSFDIKA